MKWIWFLCRQSSRQTLVVLKFLILGWQKASPRLRSKGFLFLPMSLALSVFAYLDSLWLLCPVDPSEIFTNRVTFFYPYFPSGGNPSNDQSPARKGKPSETFLSLCIEFCIATPPAWKWIPGSGSLRAHSVGCSPKDWTAGSRSFSCLSSLLAQRSWEHMENQNIVLVPCRWGWPLQTSLEVMWVVPS